MRIAGGQTCTAAALMELYEATPLLSIVHIFSDLLFTLQHRPCGVLNGSSFRNELATAEVLVDGSGELKQNKRNRLSQEDKLYSPGEARNRR